MYDIILIVGLILLLLFGGIAIFGAPYLPTLANRVNDGLDLLDLKPGQVMLELGSGDGRVMREAAKRGIYSVGYELNPLLVVFSWVYTIRYRKYVKIVWGNYWDKKWPECDGIYSFILQPHMSKLHKKVVQYSKGRSIKLVSFGFHIPDISPKDEKNGMFLYIYKS